MSTNAANEKQLGSLHSVLTQVFSKVLEQYIARMDALASGDSTLDSELVDHLVKAGWEPNPAFLATVSKFLKDNSIMYSDEEVGNLSSLEKRLADKAKQRGNVVSIKDLRSVNE